MSGSALQRWASSGAMALTGYPEQPLGPPEGLVERLAAVGRSFPGVDPLALLGERAALMGLWRRGAVSCGGSCRLVPARDGGWVAVSLPRGEDMEAVPAWLELDAPASSAPATWSAVEAAFADRDTKSLLARAALLGLPVARVGEAAATAGVDRIALGTSSARDAKDALVVDLSALWAGPLCGDLLAGAGASVVKVESSARPDGARRGPAAFFDLLNGRKRSVSFDFASRHGRDALRRLVQRADVVIEASRPRALEQLGVVAADLVRAGGPQVWVSITAYGRRHAGADSVQRVGFGDDPAAAGGLLAWSDGTPLFCADAVGDPVTGLTAAHECIAALADGGRWLLDISMAGVAAGLAGPTVPVAAGLATAEPRARQPAGAAPAMGADTAHVMEELGLAP
jgi:hypothetical protein